MLGVSILPLSVIYLCVRGIDIASFYNFSNDSVVFFAFHFIKTLVPSFSLTVSEDATI